MHQSIIFFLHFVRQWIQHRSDLCSERKVKQIKDNQHQMVHTVHDFRI